MAAGCRELDSGARAVAPSVPSPGRASHSSAYLTTRRVGQVRQGNGEKSAHDVAGGDVNQEGAYCDGEEPQKGQQEGARSGKPIPVQRIPDLARDVIRERSRSNHEITKSETPGYRSKPGALHRTGCERKVNGWRASYQTFTSTLVTGLLAFDESLMNLRRGPKHLRVLRGRKASAIRLATNLRVIAQHDEDSIQAAPRTHSRATTTCRALCIRSVENARFSVSGNNRHGCHDLIPSLPIPQSATKPATSSRLALPYSVRHTETGRRRIVHFASCPSACVIVTTSALHGDGLSGLDRRGHRCHNISPELDNS